MPLRNVATTFTIEQQRLEINNLAGDVNNIANGTTTVGTATTASALAVGATGADLTLSGTLTVNGTQTILNTATLEVEDKNIIIAKGSTTDAAASGGGITLKGTDDKTISYSQTGDKWVSNKDFEASAFYGDGSNLTGISSPGGANALSFNDDVKLIVGSGNDLEIYHSGHENYIKDAGNSGSGAGTIIVDGSNGVKLRAEGSDILHADTNLKSYAHFYIFNSKNLVMQGAGSILSTGGSIGVGISSPTRKLDVRENDASDVATFINSDLTNGYGINVKGGGTAANRYALRIANGADTECFKVKADGYIEFTGNNDLRVTLGSTGTAGENSSNWIRAEGANFLYNAASGHHKWEIGGTEAGKLTSSGWEDGIGNLRSIPYNGGYSSTTLAPSHAGQVLDIQYQLSVPSDAGIVAGQTFTIINGGSSNTTIVQGSGLTMYNAADASTGDKTLAAKGMCTLWFQSTTVCYISGAGLS